MSCNMDHNTILLPSAKSFSSEEVCWGHVQIRPELPLRLPFLVLFFFSKDDDLKC